MPSGMPVMDARMMDPHLQNSMYASLGQYAVSTVQWRTRNSHTCTFNHSHHSHITRQTHSIHAKIWYNIQKLINSYLVQILMRIWNVSSFYSSATTGIHVGKSTNKQNTPIINYSPHPLNDWETLREHWSYHFVSQLCNRLIEHIQLNLLGSLRTTWRLSYSSVDYVLFLYLLRVAIFRGK